MRNKDLNYALEECKKNITNHNSGYLDLLYIIYNNMTVLKGQDKDANQKIVNTLKEILRNKNCRLQDQYIDFKQCFYNFTNRLYKEEQDT